MLIAGAVCPHPPLLIPAALGAAASDPPAELRKVTEAAAQAVARLAVARPDLIAVVGGGPADREYGPAAAGGLHDYGIDFTVGMGEPVLPLSLTVGRWLLECAGVLEPAGGAGVAGGTARDGTGVTANVAGGDVAAEGKPVAVLFQAVAQYASPGDCLKLGMVLAERAPRVALLAMGDASARPATTSSSSSAGSSRASQRASAAASASATSSSYSCAGRSGTPGASRAGRAQESPIASRATRGARSARTMPSLMQSPGEARWATAWNSTATGSPPAPAPPRATPASSSTPAHSSSHRPTVRDSGSTGSPIPTVMSIP